MKYSFEKYCKDYKNIENYERAKADNFKGWHCHHRLETHNSDGKRREVDILAAELKALNMYYNRPASELIFLLASEHNALRKVSNITKKKMSEAKKGKHLSEEHKKIISEAGKNTYKRGRKNAMLGKHLSDEVKNKISYKLKGRKLSEETKKKLCESKKGNKYFLGKKHSDEAKKKIGAAQKGKKLSEETLKKMSDANKDKHWYNNGKENKYCYECPDGFVSGMLKRK